MKLIMHIGMGKTGTSSIQKALSQSAGQLAAQDAEYLGLWFDMLGPDHAGRTGLPGVVRAAPDEMRDLATRFLGILRERGHETYVFSNEALFGHVGTLGPFLETLHAAADLEVRYLAYVRRPHDWLPSAFTQWNIRHKQQEGPLQPYGERARTLASTYDGLRRWHEKTGDRLTVRAFDKGTDVVADFAGVTGLEVAPLDTRALERSEPAETVLRGLFNDRFEPAVLPERFSQTLLKGGKAGQVPSIDRMIDLCFDHETTDEIVQENRAMFEEIETLTGLDLRLDEPTSTPRPDPDAVRRRILDYTVEIVMRQAVELKRLQREIRELRQAGDREG